VSGKKLRLEAASLPLTLFRAPLTLFLPLFDDAP